MKRFCLFALLTLIFCSASFSQVFNTSSTLKPGQFNVGFEPVIYTGGNEFILFLNAGVGLTKGIDLNVDLGVLSDATYIGGDIEFSLSKVFSFSAGAHSWSDFALDGTLLATFPLGKPAKMFTGLDTDLVFANDLDIRLWIPLGVEIALKQKVSFIFEAEIDVLNTSYHVIGGGLNFYF